MNLYKRMRHSSKKVTAKPALGDVDTQENQRRTTYEVFEQFISYSQGTDGRVHCDTRRIFSKHCYNSWIAARAKPLKKPGESFRRALISQLTASDSRKPYVKTNIPYLERD